MNVGTYLTGAFGQSNELYKTRNKAKRDRIAPQDIKGIVNKQILKDTKTIINKQKEAGFSFIIDPIFNTYYLFQQFAENVEGIKIGSQENWFDNNVSVIDAKTFKVVNTIETGEGSRAFGLFISKERARNNLIN